MLGVAHAPAPESKTMSTTPRTSPLTPAPFSRRDFLRTTSAFAVLAAWGGSFSPRAAAAFASAEEATAYQFLNRISWGVRAEEVRRVLSKGIGAYLEEQLLGEKLRGAATAPNSILRLTRARTLKLRDRNYTCYKALVFGMLKRAATSPAQLFERVVEFWSDHFNIASEELEPDYVDFQRTVIRPHALGKFRDLLIASAKHPAMLFYLDNYLNVAEHPNENFAREVMELHTLGVDGGYTEADVKAVARALTGWTYDYHREGEGFYFDPDVHDTEAKTVLGAALAAGRGIEDGEDVLNRLASHPSTARFVCRKLAVRFVSDSPPASLVDRMVAVWTATDGDIKPVLRAMFLKDDGRTLTDELVASFGKKLRRPLDFFVGAMRATGTTFSNFGLMEYLLATLAQIPYGWHPPNGYPEPATAWANTNGVLRRWNVAQTLTDDALNVKRPGMSTRLNALIGKTTTVGDLVDKCALQVLGTSLDADKRAQLIAYVNTDAEGHPTGGTEATRVDTELRKAKLAPLCGLLLSSPMFQWR
jgi:uncharacterized protein (DUF1800 family)